MGWRPCLESTNQPHTVNPAARQADRSSGCQQSPADSCLPAPAPALLVFFAPAWYDKLGWRLQIQAASPRSTSSRTTAGRAFAEVCHAFSRRFSHRHARAQRKALASAALLRPRRRPRRLRPRHAPHPLPARHLARRPAPGPPLRAGRPARTHLLRSLLHHRRHRHLRRPLPRPQQRHPLDLPRAHAQLRRPQRARHPQRLPRPQPRLRPRADPDHRSPTSPRSTSSAARRSAARAARRTRRSSSTSSTARASTCCSASAATAPSAAPTPIYEEITRRGLKIAVVGIPKTIDNDIEYVFRTFGFATALEIAQQAHVPVPTSKPRAPRTASAW